MKINYKIFLTGVFFLVLLTSCTVQPQPIEYGKDQCSHCVMNIVDKTHAAQYVTKKGKQFKFDAIECMVSVINERGEDGLAVILVADYTNPGEMIEASKATFLISPEIKSPMGANLSALSSQDKARELQALHKGYLYSWNDLKQRLSDK